MSSTKEFESLSQFKLKVSDVSNELPEYFRSDTMMLTWLKARDFNLAKAEDMLRKSIEWRKLHDFYNLKSWDPPKEFEEDFHYEITGFTTQKYPIAVVPFGKWNLRQTIERGDKETWLKYINKIFSSVVGIVESKSELPDKIVSQFCVIVDMEGFSMKQITAVECVDAVLESAKRFEANFPETLHLAHVVNAPRIFSMLFSLIKPILSAHTQSKIQVHGSKSKKWIPALLKSLPADQLPEKYGGNLTSSASILTKGTGESQDDSENQEQIGLTIPAGEKLEVDFDIKAPGSTISWSFRTENGDIGFGVWFENSEEAYKFAKYDSHEAKQEASLACLKPGKYSMRFDNSHSLDRNKRLYYMASSSEDDEDFDEGTQM